MKNNRADREFDKFKDVNGKTAVRVSFDESLNIRPSIDGFSSLSGQTITASGAESNLINETFAKDSLIDSIYVSGENVAVFEIKKNDNVMFILRTSFTKLNEQMLGKIPMQIGDNFKIVVKNFRPDSASFEAIIGVLTND